MMWGLAKVQGGGFGAAKPGEALPLKPQSKAKHLARCEGRCLAEIKKECI